MPSPLKADLEFVDSLKRALFYGQTDINALVYGDISKLQNAAYMPASQYFVNNFVRAINSVQVTGADLQTPSSITELSTNAPADQDFVDDCTRAGLFGQVASVIENDSRLVTFSVNMNVESFLGDFNSATMGVEVRGDFNGFGGGSTLTDVDADGIYTGTFDLLGAPSLTQEYKFYTTGPGASGFESIVGNRSFALNPYGVAQILPTVYFNNLSQARKWVVSVDLSGQVSLGKFVNDGSYAAYIVGPFSGWVAAPAYQLTYTGSNSIYQATFEYEGTDPSPITYKFFTVGTLAQGYEGGSDRNVTLGASLTTTTTPTATYVNNP